MNLIILYKRRGISMAYKNADECLDCGTCADACPNDAIVSE